VITTQRRLSDHYEMACLGNEGVEVVEILDRLICCAEGAIYLQDDSALYMYLKTSHHYLEIGFLSLDKKLRETSVMTRGLRREIDELFLISNGEEVMSHIIWNYF
jgi:hypothetical protein